MMKKILESMVNKIKIIKWAYALAWAIDKRMLLLWNLLSGFVSVLPAISLTYHREITNILSKYINTGNGTFNNAFWWIVGYGITLLLIGLSTRVNKDLIYMMMYDSYYLGMQEYMMDTLQEVEITNLLKRELNDDYNYIVDRAGSLTDIMSGACELIGKFVSISSLLLVAFGTSKVVFICSCVYVISMVILNICFSDKVRWDTKDYRKVSREASYYESLPYNPGTSKEIRVFDNAEFIITQWKKANKKIKEYERKRYYQMELRTFLTSIGFFVFLMVMIFYHIFLVGEGKIEVSVFLLIFNLCLNLFATINGVARAIMAFDYGLYALGRQKKFMEHVPIHENKVQVKSQKIDDSIIFSLKDVSFAYQNEKKVLEQVSFEIKKGEVIALVGANGSGKTTLIKLLLGMYKPIAGTMTFCGIPYEEYTSKQIREKIGVFFQDFFLFHAPIYENIAYGDIENIHNIESIQSAIRNGGAEKLVNKLQDGIHTMLGKSVFTEGVELSGGEKQRIAVARAHMNEKDILILDEPASAVDPIAEAEQFIHLKEKLQGRTAILISHRVGFAKIADRIFMMQEGKLVEEGTHKELMDQKGIYADFYSKQAEWYGMEKKSNGK